MNILGVIPARFESSRFPGKPLALINGKTMIQRVYEQVKKASKITDVIIATDDKRILENVSGFGGKAILTSTSHLNGTSRCYEVFEKVNSQQPDFYDAVVNIQGDEPFINPEQINQVCDILIKKKSGIATLAKKIIDVDNLFDPNIVKTVFGVNGNALYFSRSPIPFLRSYEKNDWLKHANYYKHIGIYGFAKATLMKIVNLKPGKLEQSESLEQLRWLENELEITIDVTDFESIGIDTPEDLEKLINII